MCSSRELLLENIAFAEVPEERIIAAGGFAVT
jgi:hypothetical protein